MRIVFMGTPEAAVLTLRRLMEDGHQVVAVWTQPDKPAGRGNKVSVPPVKLAADSSLYLFLTRILSFTKWVIDPCSGELVKA